ncbi:hypothetical protein AG1IA_10327 [Rhizoctonia solani AG-1 IA]|uniref:Uncharacterized protein n=1 Tax=Thanatephorus cucumeris (strain AG1-IA) TaxID=983506 RepID=L8WFT0_THACA|nr:hypothetical protein AG1IA_10327 [Rhizoctonia solani AG-1 IA]
MKDAEILTKDRLLARKEQELQEALQTHHEAHPNNVEIQSQMDALRNQMERLELLVQSSRDHPEQRNNAR